MEKTILKATTKIRKSIIYFLIFYLFISSFQSFSQAKPAMFLTAEREVFVQNKYVTDVTQ